MLYMLQTICALSQYQRHATATSNDQISIDIMVSHVAKKRCWEELKSKRKDHDKPELLGNEAGRLAEERQWDAKEMDEFAATLKGKHCDKTPKLVEDNSSKLTPDQSQQGNLEHDEQACKTSMPLPNLGGWIVKVKWKIMSMCVNKRFFDCSMSKCVSPLVFALVLVLVDGHQPVHHLLSSRALSSIPQTQSQSAVSVYPPRPFGPNNISPPMSACDSKPEHKHNSQNTINHRYSQDTTKTWT
ncbi:hypothetical protein O181_126963 [Austropuccinia psidii MF-1]|uniref:Uncharacterized protein n=1 Tax=Austropuccinia psidii MF-1 TaxID=1389203 RepID=A0A9Q3KSA9_9BASI|nr:hypothetical protein [Austropuccinia psidii MF-1]